MPIDKASRRLVLALLLAAAALVRIGHFLEFNAGPGVWQHRWAESDMHFFDTWARHLRAGDWLTDRALHPQHGWHRNVAAIHLREHPEKAASLAVSGHVDPSRALWSEWLGGKRFYQEPMYAYLVAITYKVLGPDARWVFAWQALLGMASTLLVYLIARRYFGDLAAALSGLMMALNGPLIFYETLLLRTPLNIFAALWLVYVTDAAVERDTRRWWLIAGLSFGLSIVLKTTFALFVLIVVGIMVLRFRNDPKRMLARLTTVVASVILCLAPVVARNAAVGAPVFGLTSVGAVNVICGNAADVPPEVGLFLGSEHFAPIMGKAEGRLLPTVKETLATHGSLSSYAGQLWRKFAVLWHWPELPNNSNFYYYRLHSSVLRYLPVTFFVLAPLSLVGLGISVRLRPRCWALYGMAFSLIAPLLMFYIVSRLRLPLVIILVPFAGLALARIIEWTLDKRWGLAAATLGGVMLVAFWTGRPSEIKLVRAVDWYVPHLVYHYPQAQQGATRGDWEQVASLLEHALRFEPPELERLGPSAPASDRDELVLARRFGELHRRYSVALQKVGRVEEARMQAERAGELLSAAEAR